MNVIITGSTGMVGKGVLLECLDHKEVGSILLINRQTIGIEHPKIKEVILEEFTNFSHIAGELNGYDTCFFCLGISAVGLSEEEYKKITYDLTLNFAKALYNVNSNMTFCYISGAGTDSTEKSSTMWARVKGKTENALRKLGFSKIYMFRPGYIQPMRGIRSKTKLYNALYFFAKPLYPLLKSIAPNHVTTTENVGKAMINVILKGYSKKILKTKDINEIARG